MRTIKIRLFIVLIVLVPFLAGGVFTVNSATDEEEMIFIPPAKERSMGRKLHKQILDKFDLPVDPLVQERISRIGEKLAQTSDRKDMVYRFTALDHEKDNCFNAFAAPGGYIYIFDDLVEAVKTDDNIAAVLAHEMGHVEAKHAVKRMQGDVAIAALMLIGTQMNTEKGTHEKAACAIAELMSAYSRQDEKQADELSIKYLKGAGYDPRAAVKVIEKLQALRKKAPRARYSYYRSHPYLSERASYLDKYERGHASFDSYINLVTDKGGM
jgi:predicted Zn-dependent protease